MVKYLCENGALESISITDNKGNTPIIKACCIYKVKIVKYLFESTYREFGQLFAIDLLNYANNNGKTPIYKACKYKNLELVRYLCENGANKSINTADKNGITPLELACKSKNFEIVKCLVENGAEISRDKIKEFYISDNGIREYLQEQIALQI
jgi:ankyrin repeat protein